MAKLAIIRGSSRPLQAGSYNIQEIGLAKGLLMQGWSVDIYSRFFSCSSPKIISSENNCKARIIPITGLSLPGRQGIYPTVFFFLRHCQYDVVQVHDDTDLMSQLVARWCSIINKKVVLWQGMYLKFLGWKGCVQNIFDFYFGNFLPRYVDLTLAKTSKAQKYLEKKGFSSVKVMSPGLDFKVLDTKPSLDKFIADFTDSHSFILLYVGKLEPRRNLSFFLNVLFEVRKHYQNVGALIAGDGPDFSPLKNRTIKLGLGSDVLFVGTVPQDKLSALYKIADILLLPTRYEIFGMVILEALYHGVPVLASNEAGPQDILKKACLGQCIELKVALWVEAVLSRISRRQEQPKLLRTYVKENYSWTKIAEDYATMLYKLISI